MRHHAGFTLVELLVVCAILVAVSYLAWGAYSGVDVRAKEDLARAQLLKLAEALTRFHADTGYWPGQGPWRLVSDGGAVLDSTVNTTDLQGAATASQWYGSPANLTLLFDRPSLDPNHPLAHLASWNPATRRGWNGPYLPLANRLFVDVWPNLGEDDPGGTDRLYNLPAFGAGIEYPPAGTGYNTCASAVSGCFLGWRAIPKPATVFDGDGDGADDATGYAPGKHELAHHARPFVFLLEAPPIPPETDPRIVPRVVYWGTDGRYGGTNADAPCLPAATDPEGVDDVVICLQPG